MTPLTHRYVQREWLMHECEFLQVHKLLHLSHFLFHFYQLLLDLPQSLAQLLRPIVQRAHPARALHLMHYLALLRLRFQSNHCLYRWYGDQVHVGPSGLININQLEVRNLTARNCNIILHTHLGMLSRIMRSALIRFRLCLPGKDSGFFQVQENEQRSFPPVKLSYW